MSHVVTLTTLDLSGIEHCVDVDFADELLELSRPDRRLVGVSSNVRQLTNVTSVDLHCVAVPSEILAMTRVTSLRFTGQMALCDGLTRMRLEDLSGYECCLKRLPLSLTAMTTLRVLSLLGGQIEVIPPEFLRAATQLSSIILNRNRLASLPSDIACLRNLSMLSLSDNCLRALPRQLCLLPLETLLLTNNELRWLPLQLHRCRTLSCLMIDGNPVSLKRRERLAPGDGFGDDAIGHLPEIYAATTALGMIRLEAATIAVGLQDLELPALVTLEIIDAAFPNSIPMHLKWKLITAVKHWQP